MGRKQTRTAVQKCPRLFFCAAPRHISGQKPKLRASKLFAQITTGNRAQLGRSLAFTVPSPCWFTLRKKNQRQFYFLYLLFDLLIPCNPFTLFLGNFSCIYKRNALNRSITSTYFWPIILTIWKLKMAPRGNGHFVQDYLRVLHLYDYYRLLNQSALPWSLTITFRILRIHKISIT